METVVERNGIEASRTEVLRMQSKNIDLSRVVDFWRNPVERTLCVLLDDLQEGELVYC